MHEKNSVHRNEEIKKLLHQANRLMISTSVDGMSNATLKNFVQDGNDLIFWAFNTEPAAEQIRLNAQVQALTVPAANSPSLHIEGRCYPLKDEKEITQARQALLDAGLAPAELLNDPFLIKNKVIGYYRLKPLRIRKKEPLPEPAVQEQIEFPQNRPSELAVGLSDVLNRLKLWIRAVRAPFFTATIVPILLGAVIAWGDLFHAGMRAAWDWGLFWLILIGGILAHAGTNLANDYFDHTSNNDEMNQNFSPFNGGSRVIQAGLLKPYKVLWAAILSFVLTIAIGLYLNKTVSGAYFGKSLLIYLGFLGIALGAFYTWDPFRLGYRGLGEFSIALGFGPIMVLGTHFVLTQPLTHNNLALWHWQKPLLASIPIAILIMLVVWINQFQDLQADAQVGKNTWVVRLATFEHDQIWYEKPFLIYVIFNVIGFGFIFMLAIIGFFKPEFSTPFAFIALLPAPLTFRAIKWGQEWLKRWNDPQADRQKLPYELLRVNVSTIGVHFLTGLLMSLAYWLGSTF